MANQFITIQEIARNTLPRLLDNMVFPGLAYKDFSGDYARNLGDTIQVRRPTVLEAKEFDQNEGVTPEDLVETTVPVKLDKIATVDVEITALQGATSIDDLNRQFLEPAAAALAEKINSDGLELYKDIPYVCGTAGVTPSSLDDLAAARKALNANNVPVSPRYALWDTEADAKLVTVPAIVNADKSGSTTALEEGSLGRVMRLENYMSQAVKHHKKGTLSDGGKPKTATAAGSTTLTLSGASLTGTLVKGDILTILGDSYVVTEDAEAEGNEITVELYPALKKNVNTATVVTVLGDHTANLVFHPAAFAFVTRPLVAPSGVESYVTSYNGVSLRVVRGYNMTYKKEMLSMDVLYGFKTMYPELAVRYLG